MSEKTEKSGVNDEVKELAGKLKKDIKIDSTGVGTVTDGLYWKHLPDDLTEKTVKAVDKYTVNFCAAATKAAGELAVEAMAGNSKMENVEVAFDVRSRDTLKVGIERRKEFPNTLAGKDADPIVKHAATTIGYSANAGKNSQLAAARSEIAELGLAKLAGRK